MGFYFARWTGLTVPPNVRIRGKRVSLQIPAAERAKQEYELLQILVHDRYCIRQHRSARRILDIGANLGFFSLSARQACPFAEIHAYEPNSELLPTLRHHAERLDVRVFSEALGGADTKAHLCFQENSLHTRTIADPIGETEVVSLATATHRLGGGADFIKLDCEGAEWDLFEDAAPWTKVRCLAMEYHLWARPGSTVNDVVTTVRRLGFEVQSVEETGPSWGMLFAAKRSANTGGARG